MSPFQAALTELLMFFVIFPVTFKAMMALDISRFFRRGAIWQIQIIHIFLSIALAFLVSQALSTLIILMATLAS